MKAFTDDKKDVVEIMISLLDGVKSIVGKGENADYQHFLPFPQCSPKPSPVGLLKVGIFW